MQKKTAKNGIEELGTEPIGRLLWKYILPSFIGLLTHVLYNIVDRIFIGQFQGQIGLSAITIVFPIMMVFIATSILIGVGGSALISLRLGEGDEKQASNILGNSVTLGVLIAASISILGFIFSKEVLLFSGANNEILPHAIGYYRIMLLANPFLCIGFALTFTIRAEGNPKLVVYLLTISSFINIILDAVFIIGFSMGVKGAAWATFIAEAVTFSFAVGYYLKGPGILKIKPVYLIPRWSLCSRILLIGLPASITDLMTGFQNLLLNLQLVKYGGTVAVASMGVVFAVFTIARMPMFAIADSFQPIIGYNYSAGHFERVRRTVFLVASVIIGFSIFFIVPVAIMADLCVRIFSSDKEIITMASRGLRLFILGLPFFGLFFTGTRYFQAIGKAGFANLISLCKPVLFFMPVLYLAPLVWGLDGIWVAESISSLFASILVGTLYFYEKRKSHANNSILDG